ncbi:MAG: ABC-type glycerol-3-phosphate transport system substrate-binding protein [Candidatus Paceibacteria bacterium]|jgi:ABC-type glycerol-3-phosphate transport system substrate-binding protein
MKLHPMIVGLGFAAATLLAACGAGVSATAPATGKTAATSAGTKPAAVLAVEPTLDTLPARSVARWETVVAVDWIQAYEFLDPTIRQLQPLGQYMAGKENHEYRNPSAPLVIGSDGELGYVELSVLWEPHHPILQTVANAPDDMTDELHMVETWRWDAGEWYFVKNERAPDFHKEHPGLKPVQPK